MVPIVTSAVFWGFLLLTVWMLRPGSKLLDITLERWTMVHRFFTILMLIALIGSSSFLMTLCPMWNGENDRELMDRIAGKTAENDQNTEAPKGPDRFAIKNKNQYEMMAEALLNGSLELDYGDMDERLLEMENPYDVTARRKLKVIYHWDHAFYNGHYYMYFGIVPVFLLFLPYRVITGASLTTYHATQIFVALSIIGFFLFFRLLARKFFPKIPFAVYLLLGAAVSVTGFVHCVAKPAMYMTAIAAGVCMEVWSTYFYVKAVWATEGENRAIFRAFLGALLGALAFGCRPTTAIGNLIVIPCLVVFLRNHKINLKLILKLIAAASPYIIIGFLLMRYNYMRFENPFEFGQSYQLTVADQSLYGSAAAEFTLRDLINGVIYFFYKSEELVEEALTGFVEGGIFFSYPVYIAGLFAFTNKKVRRAISSNKLGLFLAGGIITILTIIFADTVWTPYLLARYKEDMMWLLGMLIFIIAGMRYAGEEEIKTCCDPVETDLISLQNRGTGEYSFVLSLAAIYSIIVSAIIFVQLDADNFTEEHLEAIRAIFYSITFGLWIF